MTHSYIGIDSTTFFHIGTTTFKAPLGVAVETENYEQFNEKYIEIINELKATYGLDTEKICLKGHYVFSKIGENLAIKFINDFVDKILPYLKMIYVDHAVIPPTKIPEIKYSMGKSMPTIEFLNALISSFNHLVVWNLLQTFPKKTTSYIFVDHFTGFNTKAWEELENNDRIFVLPAGEYCNPLISTADFICKYINDMLYRNYQKLGFEGISFSFASKNVTEYKIDSTFDERNLKAINTWFLQTSNSPFSMLTPISSRSIQIDAKLKHPVLYILTSQKLKKEKELLENTPMFDKLTNQAYEIQGSVKSINVDEIANEIKYMKAGDKIITIGEDAHGKAKYLVEDLTGLELEVISSKEILKSG